MELPAIASTLLEILLHPATTAVIGFGAGIAARFFHDRFQRRDNAGAALSTSIGRRYFAKRDQGVGQPRLLTDDERRELGLIMSRRKFARLSAADDAYAECHKRNLQQDPASTWDHSVIRNPLEVKEAAQRFLDALPGL